ncbi:Hypothetical predicted protein [Lecanosticta acicola]|uniref:Uncharacterized protein n=1 Tax=Lecanosticta acicola TaxID=111012 RepID=A0AAI8YYC8_9PEZI|nr:Hypothetical predicted protein [Lecanosticta acicola]
MAPAWLNPANWFRRQVVPPTEIEYEDEYEPQLDELTETPMDIDDAQPFTPSLRADEEDDAVPEDYGEEFAPDLEEEDITERLIARRNKMELYTNKELDERIENQYATVLRKLKERDFDAATAWRLIVGLDAVCKRDRSKGFHDLIEPVLLGTVTIAAIIDDMGRYVVPSKYRNHERYNEVRGTAMDLFQEGWPQDFLHAFIKEIQSDLIPVEDWSDELENSTRNKDAEEMLFRWAPQLWEIWREGPTKMDGSSVRRKDEDVVMSGIGTPEPRTSSNSPRTPKCPSQASSGRGSQTPSFYTANDTMPESDSGSDAETTVDEIIDDVCLGHRYHLEFTDDDLDQIEKLGSSGLGPVDVWRIFAVLLEELGSAEAVLADSRLYDITSGGRRSRKWLDWYDDHYKVIFSDCGPELRRTAKYLWARGFDEHFVKRYMDILRGRYPVLGEEEAALAVQLEDHFENVDVLDWLSRWAPELNTIWSRELPEDAPESAANRSSSSSDDGNDGDDDKDKAADLGNRYPLRTPPLRDDGSDLPDYEQSPPGTGPLDSGLPKDSLLQKLMYGNGRFDLPRGGRKSKKQELSDSGHRPGVDTPHSPPPETGRSTTGPKPKPYQPTKTSFTPGVDTPHSPPPPKHRSPTPKSVPTARARRQSVLPSREEINARVVEKTKSQVKGDTMVVQLRALKDRGYSVRDALHLWVETREVTEGPMEQVKKLQELRNHPMDAQDFLQRAYREAFSVVKDPHLRQTLKSLWWKGFDSRYIWNYILELEAADPSLETDDLREADVLEMDLGPWDISEWLFQFRPRFREVWDESEVKADLVTPLSSPKPSGRSLLDEDFLDLTDRPFIWNYLHGQGQDRHWVQDFPDWDKRDSSTLVRSGLDQFLAWRLVDGLSHRRIEGPERIAALDLLASDKALALRVLAAYKEQMFQRLGLLGEEFEEVRKAMTEMVDSSESEPFLEYAVRQDCEERTPEKLHDFITELAEERRKLEKENPGKLLRRCILGDYFYDTRISRNGTEMAYGDRKLYEGYNAPTNNFDESNGRYFRDFVLQAVDPGIWQECAFRGWGPARAWATLTAIFYPRFRNDTVDHDRPEDEEYGLAVKDPEYRKRLILDWCSDFAEDLRNREDPEMVELVESYMDRHLDGFLIEKLKHDLLATGNYATRRKLYGALSDKLSEKNMNEWTFEWVPSLRDAWLGPRDPSPGGSDDGGDDDGDDDDGESGKDGSPPRKRSRESHVDSGDEDGNSSDDDSPPPPKRPRSGTPFPHDEYGASDIVSDPLSPSDSDFGPDDFPHVARRLSYNSPTPPRPATPLGPNVSFEEMFTRNRPTPKSTFKDFRPKKVDNLRYTNRLWTPRRLPNTPTKSHLPPSPRRKGPKPRTCEACGRPFRVTKKKQPAEPRRAVTRHE